MADMKIKAKPKPRARQTRAIKTGVSKTRAPSKAKKAKPLKQDKAALTKPDHSLRQLIGRKTIDNMKGKLLVIIDETSEALTALRFAGISAKKLDSNIVLLMVLEPNTSRHWLGVETLMQEEARQEAMSRMRSLASEIDDYANISPQIVIREGTKFDQICQLVGEDKDITAIVLGAAQKGGIKNQQPLMEKLISGELEELGVPLIVVPEKIAETMLHRIARIV